MLCGVLQQLNISLDCRYIVVLSLMRNQILWRTFPFQIVGILSFKDRGCDCRMLKMVWWLLSIMLRYIIVGGDIVWYFRSEFFKSRPKVRLSRSRWDIIAWSKALIFFGQTWSFITLFFLSDIVATDGYLLSIKIKHKRRGGSLCLPGIIGSRVVVVGSIGAKVIVFLAFLVC